MKSATATFTGDLAGQYYPLTGMDEAVRQQLVDDHFLFVSGDRNLTVAGMEGDWPEGRGIFHNDAKTFLLWVNEEDQTRIISMEKGGDVKGVFARLARGIAAVQESVKAESGKEYALSEQYGYIHSSPGITKQQRIDVEALMSNALSKLSGDLAGKYYPLTGMDEAVRQQLVDDHFLFVSGDRNLTVAGMERDWPEGRGIFH